jgi:hypothetical protein
MRYQGHIPFNGVLPPPERNVGELPGNTDLPGSILLVVRFNVLGNLCCCTSFDSVCIYLQWMSNYTGRRPFFQQHYCEEDQLRLRNFVHLREKRRGKVLKITRRGEDFVR